jgi:hypothetical protein
MIAPAKHGKTTRNAQRATRNEKGAAKYENKSVVASSLSLSSRAKHCAFPFDISVAL